MSDLKATLEHLAAQFAIAAVAAIQHASLDDIAGFGGTHHASHATHATHAKPHHVRRSRKRIRRSAEDIAKVTAAIVSLLGKHKNGLRAEQIRADLGITKAELASPIAEGLSHHRFKKHGQRRATVYFVGTTSAKASSAPVKRKRAKRAKKKSRKPAAAKRKGKAPNSVTVAAAPAPVVAAPAAS